MTTAATTRLTGTVKFFNPDNGYGFVKNDAGGTDAFLHIHDVHGEFEPNKDDRVSYLMGADRNGRPKAVDVRIEDPR
jgi:cold shock protein